MTTARPIIRNRNLPLLFLQARERVFARFRPILNDNGITEQQWRIVRALLESGPLEPREIGALCHLSSPSLAGVLARMDDLGLVNRERLASDQRRDKVSLTAKSRQLAARMAPRIEATYRELEASLGGDFAQRLYAMLDELIDRLEPAGEEAAGEEA